MTDGDNNNANMEVASPEEPGKKKCCSLYDGNRDAGGFSWLGVGRGGLLMSNIFLNQSLLYLASDEVGCVVDGEVQDCTVRVYGLYPASLIATIATVTGVGAALFMPICGAFVDLTHYRRSVGKLSALVMTVIQFVQVWTIPRTWYAMLILQSIAGVLYQVQVLSVYAYLPDIAREVGQSKMTNFSSKFSFVQFTAQLLFLLVIAVISFLVRSSPVDTARISQGINTFTCLLFFGTGWLLYMTPRPAARKLPEGHSLITEGFRRNWQTAKSIQKHYKNGLRWFFLGLALGEAAGSAVFTLAVIYLTQELNLSSTETSIFFVIALLGTLPGTVFGGWVTKKTNPNTSWKLSMVVVFVFFSIGALGLEYVAGYWAYVWAACIGFPLGWFYPTENVFFSMCLPPNQEAELSGFFVFCTQILGWLPPLIFTAMIESGIRIKYGLLVTNAFFLLGAGVMMCTCSWEGIIEEAKFETAAVMEELHEGEDDVAVDLKADREA